MGKTTMRCSSCHKSIDVSSQFCKHCGYQIKRIRKETRCQKCRKMVEPIATYCVHCGFNLHERGRKGGTAVRVLKYFISVLLVILVLVIFFTILYKQEERRAVQEEPKTTASFLDINSLSCEDVNGMFNVCGKFAWKGVPGDYVTVSVPGARLDLSDPFRQEQFDFCSDAGAAEGFRVVRMILHNSASNVVDEVSRGVACKREAPRTVQLRARVVTDVLKRGAFRAERTTTYKRGFDTVYVTFPGTAESCSYDGTYVVDDKPVLRGPGGCNKATGQFHGAADRQGQYATHDPDFFSWDYKVKLDPEPRTYDGYFFTMKPCESSYYQTYEKAESLNYVRARINGFGTATLAIAWEFRDDAADRAVDVSYELRCKVRSSPSISEGEFFT